MVLTKILSILALLGSIAWMVVSPGFEPALAIIGSLTGLITAVVVEKRKDSRAGGQRQKVTGNGVGIQAGRDLTVGDIRQSVDRK